MISATVKEHNLEWDPNERDAWVSDAQRWISDIKGVLQCKIDLDPEGEISGIHVVAGMDRDPRHIVRDVESLLKARLEIDVFYKKIGVVQVMESDAEEVASAPSEEQEPSQVTFHPPTEEPATAADTSAKPSFTAGAEVPLPAVLLAEEGPLRILCSGVGLMVSERLIRAEVQLGTGETEVRGTREGSNHPGNGLQLVAQATLDAVVQLVEDPILLTLTQIRVDQLAGEPVVLSAVELVEGRRSELLFGSCSSRHNEQQAVVFSVLDALNRRLSMYALKSGASEN